MAASAQVEGGGDFLQTVESQQVCQAQVQESGRAGFKHLDIPMEPAEVFAVGGSWGTRLVTWQDQQDRRLLVCRASASPPSPMPALGAGDKLSPRRKMGGGHGEGISAGLTQVPKDFWQEEWLSLVSLCLARQSDERRKGLPLG